MRQGMTVTRYNCNRNEQEGKILFGKFKIKKKEKLFYFIEFKKFNKKNLKIILGNFFFYFFLIFK